MSEHEREKADEVKKLKNSDFAQKQKADKKESERRANQEGGTGSGGKKGKK